MNHVYRLIWREAAGGFVAVAEMARASGARSASKAAVVSSVVLAMAGAHAAGTGFQVVDGSATLATSGSTSTVTQTSHGVRIDWQTLGVAAGETLKFVQPSANAVALNVVTGSTGTQILGQLLANGNVFILNPNGVLVGKGAQVSVGGFLASTDDLTSFNATTGAVALKANASTAEVRNAGTIVATAGGMVALVGNKVINAGTILAPGGGIYLLGGGRAEFKPGDGSPFTYSLTTDTARAKSVSNTGTLNAAGGAIAMDARSSKQAVVNARGIIEAGGVNQGPDGSIRLTALGGAGEITNWGSLSAGKTGTVKAELDAGGQLLIVNGDPNDTSPSLPDDGTWLSAQDKTYDGSTAATVAVDLTKFGKTTYFELNLSKASFTSRNANEQASVSLAGTINKSFDGPFTLPATLTAAIHKAQLTLSAVTDTKTYDGGTGSSQSVLVSGLVGGDSVNGLTQSFDSRNAGSRTLSVDGGYTVADGNNGGNYIVTTQTAQGVTNKAQLTLTAASDTKTYDGGTASGQGVTVSGLVKGDSVTGLTQSFDSRNAGGRTLGVDAGYTVADGNNGDNYTVTTQTAQGAIDKAQLTLTAVADTKVADGTTTSNGAPLSSGLVGNDTVGNLRQSFDSSDVGPRGMGIASGYTVNDGNGGNNYNVTLVAAQGEITAPPVTNPPANPPDLGTVINNGGTQNTPINVDLAGLGDLLAQLPPTAAGEEEDPEKIKARRRSDRSPLRVTEGGVKSPATQAAPR